ncbi:MAG: transglutaminase-like domain-containing protein [Candidatus Thermoplasmatota archaeon]|nr:transglutaminase-like domain-containing protein [Candidatus Thermoplasmatota archaeon]
MRLEPNIPGGYRVHGARRGPPPGLNVRRGGKRRGRKKKSNLRNMTLVIVVALLFLFTPAQERVSNQLEKWLDDIMEQLGPAREYPVHAAYTVERNVHLFNPHSQDISFSYELPIPELRTDFGISEFGYESVDGSLYPVHRLQEVVSMVASVDGFGNQYAIPIEEDYLLADDALSLDPGTEIYWPPVGQNNERCSVARCAIWQGIIAPQQMITLVVSYDVISSSYSWWGDDRAPEAAPRAADGLSIHSDNDGDYSDYERSGRLDSMYDQFGLVKKWYDRDSGQSQNWAVDGTSNVVIALADEIESSLSPEDVSSPYEFAHAAFIKIRDSILYGQGLSPARGGAACINDGVGDCDEQSNAWMSLLRTRNIPAWYEFGPMTDGQFSQWEPHAWSNAIFPLDEGWCQEKGIELSTCFVEGEVDVVNNRWLLHTPTTMTEWIEQPSYQGEVTFDFYRPLSIGCINCWEESWETIGTPEITGGTYRVPVVRGE